MKKKELGQFYTRKSIWFNEPVKEFLKDNMKSNNIILDPFAGEGDILNFLKE
ncbi:hypothetical protein ['Camptotheca acuminata' phytoplasma]|uniref:hypothetical protein n=1 Tax='Camptotheca acuminata' phytoplasma TaxID=3239192 RepID=UPI00351A0945